MFAAMMKDEIAPALRGLGFVGSGVRYRLPDAGYWAQIGFQKSRSSTAETVKFTVNLSVIERDVWERARLVRGHLPERPSPNTGYVGLGWTERIGGVMAPCSDEPWWTVRRGRPTAQVAAEVVAAIGDHALPALRGRIENVGHGA
ncbi:DUF4304 domain-containing protein [Actinomadura algeriensis]|uniref:DUF4304 domain-containing protein n=1 Tax=Actinomadura algeriensis TaxID=1679523 RepID=A0ABR9JJW2_9ACTN|nr:DUF4304 domain-containing protein [Actinomadura algeriensis]MBE1530803.1 hypothetical protein [Actinomadura algeriensis]